MSMRNLLVFLAGFGLASCAAFPSFVPPGVIVPDRPQAASPQAAVVEPPEMTEAAPAAKPKAAKRRQPKFVAETAAPKTTSGKAHAFDPMASPDIGSPEWQRKQDEIERRQKELDVKLRSICRGC